MNEQERRAEYCKRTGRIATSDQSGYLAFCQGIEYERDNLQIRADELIEVTEPLEARIKDLEAALTDLLSHKTIDYADRSEAQYVLANKEVTK